MASSSSSSSSSSASSAAAAKQKKAFADYIRHIWRAPEGTYAKHAAIIRPVRVCDLETLTLALVDTVRLDPPDEDACYQYLRIDRAPREERKEDRLYHFLDLQASAECFAWFQCSVDAALGRLTTWTPGRHWDEHLAQALPVLVDVFGSHFAVVDGYPDGAASRAISLLQLTSNAIIRLAGLSTGFLTCAMCQGSTRSGMAMLQEVSEDNSNDVATHTLTQRAEYVFRTKANSLTLPMANGASWLEQYRASRALRNTHLDVCDSAPCQLAARYVHHWICVLMRNAEAYAAHYANFHNSYGYLMWGQNGRMSGLTDIVVGYYDTNIKATIAWLESMGFKERVTRFVRGAPPSAADVAAAGEEIRPTDKKLRLN